MELARVEGTVVSTIKTSRLKGFKLLVLQILNAEGKPTGNFVVGTDTVGAGFGEVVILVRGSSARQTDDMANIPTDASVVAIVDSVEFQGKAVYQKNAAESR
jgi:microcompartment protein CcmK/EutM